MVIFSCVDGQFLDENGNCGNKIIISYFILFYINLLDNLNI